ncbi:hypothetical protein ASALC70_01742 [Alcanivorax sp. ALC70]|nr:hypothetical protein ASALC70_01742 [Alcanivorax sp. ALC70]
MALASATLLLLLVDSQIHGLYGFHINGFVWNLLVTPGGIDSMGGGDGTLITVAAVALMVVGLEAGLMALIVRRPAAAAGAGWWPPCCCAWWASGWPMVSVI